MLAVGPPAMQPMHSTLWMMPALRIMSCWDPQNGHAFASSRFKRSFSMPRLSTDVDSCQGPCYEYLSPHRKDAMTKTQEIEKLTATIAAKEFDLEEMREKRARLARELAEEYGTGKPAKKASPRKVAVAETEPRKTVETPVEKNPRKPRAGGLPAKILTALKARSSEVVTEEFLAGLFGVSVGKVANACDNLHDEGRLLVCEGGYQHKAAE